MSVSSSTQSVNVTLPTENVYQFAVSANTDKFSSGMVWVTCNILHNKGEEEEIFNSLQKKSPKIRVLFSNVNCNLISSQK